MSEIDAVFLDVFGRLPRAGPGDEKSTLRALEVVRSTLEPRFVLDAGCGPGVQTLVLARALSDAEFLVVDSLPHMVQRTREALEARGLGPRVRAHVADMRSPGLAAGSVDLVWSEGAAYAVGVQAALEAWRPLLTPAGHVAFSELTWSGADRPEQALAFFRQEYPPMTDVAGNQALIEAAGYQLLESFPLPDSAWWEPYYGPLLARVRELRPRCEGDPRAVEVLDQALREAEMFRRYSRAYGYTFFVVRPA